MKVKILDRYFTEDDIGDGEIDYQTEVWEEIDCTPDLEDGETATGLAIDALRDKGCTEGSSSQFHPGVWFSDPDGSFVSNYYTGERIERAGFLEGFTEQEQAEIYAGVTGR